jgi:hypothetical protein
MTVKCLQLLSCDFSSLKQVYSFCSHLRNHPVHRLHCGKVHHDDWSLNCLNLHGTEFFLLLLQVD